MLWLLPCWLLFPLRVIVLVLVLLLARAPPALVLALAYVIARVVLVPELLLDEKGRQCSARVVFVDASLGVFVLRGQTSMPLNLACFLS